MSIPCVIVRISNGDILNNNYEISEEIANDGPAGLGLEADLKVLIKHEPFAKPEPDFRYYTRHTIKEVTSESHPDYPLFEVYKTTYTTPKKEAEEIKQIAENAEIVALNELFPPSQQVLENSLAIGVLFRSIDGLSLNPKEQKIANRAVRRAVKIWQNRDILLNKKAAIDNGEEPDLESDYDRTPVTE